MFISTWECSHNMLDFDSLSKTTDPSVRPINEVKSDPVRAQVNSLSLC